MSGRTLSVTRATIRHLTRSSLVTKSAVDRYEMHDLLRAYARELTEREDSSAERRGIIRRLFDHYLQSSLATSRHLNPDRINRITPLEPAPGVAPFPVTSEEDALEWFDAELPTLLTVVREAERSNHDHHAWQMAWAMADLFHATARMQDWLDTQRIATTSADKLGDPVAKAHCALTTGDAHAKLFFYNQIVANMQRASLQVEEAYSSTHRLLHMLKELSPKNANFEPLLREPC
jgi:fructosamine-3-kinase